MTTEHPQRIPNKRIEPERGRLPRMLVRNRRFSEQALASRGSMSRELARLSPSVDLALFRLLCSKVYAGTVYMSFVYYIQYKMKRKKLHFCAAHL